MADVVYSVTNTPIRLTDERWAHIVLTHPEIQPFRQAVLDTVAHPERVLLTPTGE